MRNERVTFPGAHGDELSARLSLPPDGEVVAYALFAHCFTCSKDLKAAVNISRALTQQGKPPSTVWIGRSPSWGRWTRSRGSACWRSPIAARCTARSAGVRIDTAPGDAR